MARSAKKRGEDETADPTGVSRFAALKRSAGRRRRSRWCAWSTMEVLDDGTTDVSVQTFAMGDPGSDGVTGCAQSAAFLCQGRLPAGYSGALPYLFPGAGCCIAIRATALAAGTVAGGAAYASGCGARGHRDDGARQGGAGLERAGMCAAARRNPYGCGERRRGGQARAHGQRSHPVYPGRV